MRVGLHRILVVIALLVSIASNCFPVDSGRAYEKGAQAFAKKDYREAEKQFRAVTKARPDFLYGHILLGHCLFHQGKYKEAIPEYERARECGEKAGGMEQFDERIVTDMLGTAYGASGRLKEAQHLLEAAIPKDPLYPMYYYILSCVLAEQGDLDQAITNLKLGFQRKANMLPGESYPNPRKDDSFTKYLGNENFEAALKEMGF